MSKLLNQAVKAQKRKKALGRSEVSQRLAAPQIVWNAKVR